MSSSSDKAVAARRMMQAARGVLTIGGWCQGFPVTTDGRHCLVGALDAVDVYELGTRGTGSSSVWVECVRRLRLVVGETSLVGWNDRPGRTLEEVLFVLDRAIAQE